ncbi:hypothetical protein GCM10022228_20380 [Halomonas cibimaris]|uniref:Uncharacterized protein n=1 Tax=Halomonas cibimaris TaxID=657012 RepID=A0ABP7M190_9GAMM
MKKTSDPAGRPSFPVLPTLILVTGLALAAFGWYALSHWLHGSEETAWYPPAKGCNLHQESCTAVLGEKGQLTFTVATADGRIEALEMLPLEVTVQGIDARSATVDFIGREMDMGLHRFVLQARREDRFTGQGQVGLCVHDVMPWRARVVVDTPDGRIGSWFDFDVVKS